VRVVSGREVVCVCILVLLINTLFILSKRRWVMEINRTLVEEAGGAARRNTVIHTASPIAWT
jgi:hypothetical protein